MRILGVDSPGGISGGGSFYLFKALGKTNEVRSITVKLSKLQFLEDLVRSFSPYPNPYAGFPESIFPNHKNVGSFIARTQNYELSFRRMVWKPDVVLQLGVYLSTGTNALPYTCYIDATSKMAEREYPPWGEMYRSKTDKMNWMKLQQVLFLKAYKVFTMSENTRKSVIEDFHVRPDKVVAVYAGPNLAVLPSFEKNVGKKMILFVGGDFRRKGGVTLLRAFKEVKKRIPNAELFIVGSSPQIHGSGITVRGFVTKKELANLYKEASIFVMPSLFEPFGHVFLEAMAYKTPCIGCKKDAMPEIIEEGKSGFTVPINNHLQLADKIEYLLSDENTIKRMGEVGRQRVELSFNWDAVAKRITEQLT